MRPGVRLGIDVGDVRIGVARTDPQALLATPVETVRRGEGDVARVLDLAQELEVVEIVVGYPRSLSGRLGPAAMKASAYAETLLAAARVRQIAASVRLVDERLTTVSAERVLREQGRRGRKQRAVVDQAAAVVILQHAIESERSTGRPPGQEVIQSS
ncbi:MAG: Holliday junction resolvase RuvX [Nocardioidaceae bacterium]|nr:Holliday junction resolvase RuvX [Nocardioidaceae bacterium]